MWARESRPDQWDKAPLAAGFVYFSVWLWPAVTAPSTGRLFGLIQGTLILIVIGLFVMAGVEKHLIDPPEELSEFEERWSAITD